MNSYELGEKIAFFRNEQTTFLREYLAFFREFLDKSDNRFASVLQTQDTAAISSFAKQYNNQIIAFAKNFKAYDPSKLITHINDYQNDLVIFLSNFRQNEIASNLSYSFHEFIEAFNRTFYTNKPHEIMLYIIKANQLLDKIEIFENTLKMFYFSLRDQKATDDESEINILFDGHLTLEKISRKLKSFDQIHKEVLQVFNYTQNEYPIKIIKIESGSLNISVASIDKVVEFIVWLCKNSIQYIHRNFTKEGKLASIPKKYEAMDKAIKISEKLNNLGVDTTDANEIIQKCHVKIANELNVLFEDTASVKINEEHFELSESIKANILEEGLPKLIQDTSE